MIKSKLINLITSNENLDSYLTQAGKIYTYLNPVSYLLAQKLKDYFIKFDNIFIDGSLLAFAVHLFYGKKIKRRSFDMTSMAPEVFEFANTHNKNICIVATKQEYLDKTIKIFSNKWPMIRWVGCRNGFFSSDNDMEKAANEISNLPIDFLIVGMGIGLQEKFLLMCKEAGFQGIGFTCGGFIHQTAILNGKIDYYPTWVNKMNLRFFYRMYKEPHTRNRYIKAFFIFPVVFLKEKFWG